MYFYVKMHKFVGNYSNMVGNYVFLLGIHIFFGRKLCICGRKLCIFGRNLCKFGRKFKYDVFEIMSKEPVLFRTHIDNLSKYPLQLEPDNIIGANSA